MTTLRWDSFGDERDASGVTGTAELTQGYDHGSLTRGLVAYFKLDSGSGTTAVDSVFGNDGAITGATWTTTSQLGGNALSFDGTDDYVQTDLSGVLRTGYVTASAWVQGSATTNDRQSILSFGEGTGSQTLVFALAGDGSTDAPRFWIHDGSSWNSASGGSSTYGSWTHLAGTYNGETIRLFQDGAEVASYAHAGSMATHQSSTDVIGARNTVDQDWLNGIIDEVRLYDRPLSHGEIATLADLTQPSTVAPGDTLQ